MRGFVIASTLLALAFVTFSGSIAYAGLPPTVLWQDNCAGQRAATSISTLGWSAIPGFNPLTSYKIEAAYEPPRSVRTFGMGVNAVYTLYQPVTGMESKTSQWFHFRVHQANGNSTTLLDEVRVGTSGGCVFHFRIAEREAMALAESPGGNYNSGGLGDKLSDDQWHDFDIKYDNAAGTQTVSYYINNGLVWSRAISNPGYITSVQFVQQGAAKPTTGENHLIGEMRIGTADLNCTPPAAPTGIAAAPATICSGESSTLSVNAPGAGLTTDWFTVSCGGTPVPSGTGVNSVVVSPTSATTYYARTRNTADGCVSTCQPVTVTIANCDDSNASTTDTCSNGVCSHTNLANGTACEDGNPCTQGDTCQNGMCVSGTPVDPCDTSNGFDADWILPIRGGDHESQVRKLSKAGADDGNSRDCDLGRFGKPEYRSDMITVATFHNNDPANNAWQDTSLIKSLCFSNSPVAGAHSPPGARLFGVYEVRNLSTDFDNNGNLVPQEGQQETYWGASFQIVELNAAGKRIRVMEVGLAANLYDGVNRGIDDPNGPNTDRNILTDPHWGPNEEGWVYTRNNVGGVRLGAIRYNKAKDTLCVACNVAERGTGDPGLPPVGRVYEFALPDWEEVYYTGGPYAGEPIPQSDPSVVKLVQIYEMPSSCLVDGVYQDGVTPAECVDRGGTWEGHSISQDNGGTGRQEHQRPAITFDDDGTMYFTSLFFAATGISINENGLWAGEPLYHGDVVKCETRGRWAGKKVYTVPIHGADACNIVISAANQDLLTPEYPPLPPSVYASGPGLAVRGSQMNQLLQMPEVTCNDTNNAAWPLFEYLTIFDLTATRTDYPCELQRIKSVHRSIPFSGLNWDNASRTLYCDPGVGAFASYTYSVNENLIVFTAGPGVGPLNTHAYVISAKLGNDAIVLSDDINGAGGNITDHSIAGEINLSRADLPRMPLWAQYDEAGARTYLGNEMGACDAAQNFMFIRDDDTVVSDVGYFLISDGNLNHVWDAASPPPIPPDNQIGACCLPDHTQAQMTQTACSAAGGLWLGKGTANYEFPCPGQGACCKRCGQGCSIAYESDCAGPNDVWKGEHTTCDQVVCDLCSVQPMDGDCDGDVDQADFATIEACFTGGGVGQLPPGLPMCTCFDRGSDAPGDLDIDSYDWDAFEQCASGSGIAASPACLP
jgi:hypothetical protein